MTRPTFVHEQTGTLRPGDRALLEGPEGHHAAVVRRLRVGEPLTLTDGRGARAEVEVATVGKAVLEVDVTQVDRLASPRPRLLVVQALTKGERGELAVELLTEVGADVIVPWSAERCIVRWSGERGAKSLRRWRSTAHEAAKQSRRAWFPEVTDLHSTTDLAGLVGTAGSAFVLHESAHQSIGVSAAHLDRGDVVVVVGPEGGITDAELRCLGDAGAMPLRLGPTVLRASTAGAVAAGALLSRTDRWS